MRRALCFVVGLLAALPAAADSFKIPNLGTLSVYALEGWKILSEDMGDKYELLIVPSGENGNAVVRISINIGAPEELSDHRKLRERVLESAKVMQEKSVERKLELQQFYSRQGFGYYVTLTDRERVGMPVKRGSFKMRSVGLICLAPRTVAAVSILADSATNDDYQQLLGIVEGMELTFGK